MSLTPEDKAGIARMYADNVPLIQIARAYHMGINTLHTHLPDDVPRERMRQVQQDRVNAVVFPAISDWMIDNNASFEYLAGKCAITHVRTLHKHLTRTPDALMLCEIVSIHAPHAGSDPLRAHARSGINERRKKWKVIKLL